MSLTLIGFGPWSIQEIADLPPRLTDLHLSGYSTGVMRYNATGLISIYMQCGLVYQYTRSFPRTSYID